MLPLRRSLTTLAALIASHRDAETAESSVYLTRKTPAPLCAALLVIWWLPVPANGDQRDAQQRPTSAASQQSLEVFLRNYLKVPLPGNDQATTYDSAFVDLNGDKTQEAVVYVTGGGWCGSGGCLTLILRSVGSSYRVVGNVPITRPPIRVLQTTKNGWCDLSVWVRGGGVLPGYEAILPFNGTKYPSNPSMAPARRMRGALAGEVLIAGDR